MGGRHAYLMTVMVGAAALACSSGDDADTGVSTPPPEVQQIEATGMVPKDATIGVMDGLRTQQHDEGHNVVVSRDGGATWTAAELPSRPAELQLNDLPLGLYANDDLAVVTGRDQAPASDGAFQAQAQFMAWITIDGEEWVRHVFDTAGGLVGTPEVTAVGPLLVVSVSSTEGFNLYTSADRGSSWQRAEVDGIEQEPGSVLSHDLEPFRPVPASEPAPEPDDDNLHLVVAEARDRAISQVLTSVDGGATWSAEPCEWVCPGPVDDDEVLVRYDDVSTDGGATWAGIEVEPALPGDGTAYLSTVHEASDGWLASVQRYDDADENTTHGALVQSDDGRAWQQVLASDPCAGEGRPHPAVSDPLWSEDRWYVTYDCVRSATPGLGIAYSDNADGTDFEPLEPVETSAFSLGDPFVAGDHILVPQLDNNWSIIAFTSIS
jgi:hypothetical protein